MLTSFGYFLLSVFCWVFVGGVLWLIDVLCCLCFLLWLPTLLFLVCLHSVCVGLVELLLRVCVVYCLIDLVFVYCCFVW